MTGSARLFSALLPASEVVASLREELARRPPGPGAGSLRWTTEDQWHVTLGFYGADDPEARQRWLRRRLAGRRAPTLHLAGAGTFPKVLWVGVTGDGLAELGEAVRAPGDRRAFRGHLTLARGDEPGVLEVWRRMLGESYRSPEWVAHEVVLMRSDPGERGPVYSVVARFDLDTPG